MKVIINLNNLIITEVEANQRYLIYSRLCKHWGFNKLEEAFLKLSNDENKDLLKLVDRVIFIGGTPQMEGGYLGPLPCDVETMLRLGILGESLAIGRLGYTISLCEELKDFATRDMLQNMLVDEEEHLDWMETQNSLIQKLGVQLYLAQMV